jgi:hypothetical protein
MRLLYGFFGPLRDPFYKDWLFYIFLFFELSLIGNSIGTGGIEGAYQFTVGTILYWFIFIIGGVKLRNPGLPLIFGFESHKPPKNLNLCTYSSEQETKVDLSDFEGNIVKYVGKRKEYLLGSFQSSGKKLESYIDATIALSVFEGGNRSLNAILFGPVWFKSSDLKREYQGSFCLTEEGLLVFSWRKRPNSLLDYWATMLPEIKEIHLVDGYKIALLVSTANRTIGRVNGRVMGEIITFSPRLADDASINEIALIGFYSLVQDIQGQMQGEEYG